MASDLSRFLQEVHLTKKNIAYYTGQIQSPDAHAVVLDDFLLPTLYESVQTAFERHLEFTPLYMLKGQGKVSREEYEAAPEDSRFYSTHKSISAKSESRMHPAYLQFLRFMAALAKPPLLDYFSQLAGSQLAPAPVILNRMGCSSHGEGVSWHQDLARNRVLGVIIYFNREWKNDWEGKFEWMNIDGSTWDIDPIGNRAVIFKTNTRNQHRVLPMNDAYPDVRRYNMTIWYTTESD